MSSKNHVIILEARGGNDKGSYGYRPDSMPIVKALKERGWTAEVVFYEDEHRGEIYRYILQSAAAYISRINPGVLGDETGYFQMLRELVAHGVEGLPHPDAMIAYGAICEAAPPVKARLAPVSFFGQWLLLIRS